MIEIKDVIGVLLGYYLFKTFIKTCDNLHIIKF